MSIAPATEEEKEVLDGVSPLRGLKDAIPDRMAKQTADYDVVYGIRADDQAMIFHFFPPGSDPPNKLGSWRDAYRIHDRLEAAIPKAFDVRFVKATYTSELRSFCIIVRGLGRSMDPWHFVHRFFEAIDAPL